MNIELCKNERLISPADEGLRYTGRIGAAAEAPFLIFPCTSVQMKLTGRTLKVALDNHHSYFENRLGVIVNGEQTAILLEKGEQVIDLPRLQVPHYHMHARAFVLYPLRELDPHVRLPDGRTLAQLCQACPADGLQRLKDER